MANFTPQQQAAIRGWTEQRDALIRDIGTLSVELEEKTKLTTAAAASLTDIQLQIAEVRGRIAELNALEARTQDSVSNEVAVLMERKSRLEGECLLIEEKIKGASDKYAVVTAATTALESAHDTMKDQSTIVNRVVGEIIQTSTLHTSDMKTIMTEIKSVSDQVIEKGNANIAQTGIILEKLPKYIFELQRPIPIRRAYATPKGTIIRPDEPKE